MILLIYTEQASLKKKKFVRMISGTCGDIIRKMQHIIKDDGNHF